MTKAKVKGSTRAEMEARTQELTRMAMVDEENVRLRLRVAELQADVSRATLEARCEREAREKAEKRLVWIGKLAHSGLTPSQIGDG